MLLSEIRSCLEVVVVGWMKYQRLGPQIPKKNQPLRVVVHTTHVGHVVVLVGVVVGVVAVVNSVSVVIVVVVVVVVVALWCC
jgi:hypothetical protein